MEQLNNEVPQFVPSIEFFTVDASGRHHDRLGRFVSAQAVEQLISDQDSLLQELAGRQDDEPEGFIEGALKQQATREADVVTHRQTQRVAAARQPRYGEVMATIPRVTPAERPRRQAPFISDAHREVSRPVRLAASNLPVEVARWDNEIKGDRYLKVELSFREKLRSLFRSKTRARQPLLTPDEADAKYMHLEPAVRVAAMAFDRQTEAKEAEMKRSRAKNIVPRVAGFIAGRNSKKISPTQPKQVPYKQTTATAVVTSPIVKSQAPRSTVENAASLSRPSPERFVSTRRRFAIGGLALLGALSLTTLASDSNQQDTSPSSPNVAPSPSMTQQHEHQDVVRHPEPIRPTHEASTNISTDTKYRSVAPGDSIWAISEDYVKDYGFSTNVYIVDAVKDATIKLNDFSDPNLIMPGSPIELPSERTVKSIVQKYS